MVLEVLLLSDQVWVHSKYSSFKDNVTYFNVKISGKHSVNIMYFGRVGGGVWKDNESNLLILSFNLLQREVFWTKLSKHNVHILVGLVEEFGTHMLKN